MEQLPSFDEMKEMAENNPEGLEQMRQRMIQEVIDNAPESKKKRLEGLQFQIDAKIKTARSPFEAMERIYDDMMDNFLILNDHLQQLSEASKKINENTSQKEVEKKLEDSNLKVVVNNNNKKDNS